MYSVVLHWIIYFEKQGLTNYDLDWLPLWLVYRVTNTHHL